MLTMLVFFSLIAGAPKMDVQCIIQEVTNVPLDYQEGERSIYSENFWIFGNDFVEIPIKNTDTTEGIWKLVFIFTDDEKTVTTPVEHKISPGETKVFKTKIPKGMTVKEHNIIGPYKAVTTSRESTCKKSVLEVLFNMKDFM